MHNSVSLDAKLIPKGLNVSCMHSNCDRFYEEIILPWISILLWSFVFILTYEVSRNLWKAESSFPPRFHLDLGLKKIAEVSVGTPTHKKSER